LLNIAYCILRGGQNKALSPTGRQYALKMSSKRKLTNIQAYANINFMTQSSRESDTSDNKNRHPFKQRLARSAGAFGIAAASFGAGVVTVKAADGKPARPASAVAADRVHDAVRLVDKIQSDQATAQDLAKSFTDTLRNGDVAVMRVLNGVIDAKTKSGDFRPSIKNPVLFTTADPSLKPDSKGDFLEGAWIGYQATGNDGKMQLFIELYNSDNLHFRAFDPKAIVYQDLGVYSTQMKGALYGEQLVGFDISGSQLIKNPDNTTVVPGLSISDI